MRIKIDLEKCYKSGECCYNHPRLFKLGDDGYPVILIETPDTQKDLHETEQAVEVCPSGAVSILDEDGES